MNFSAPALILFITLFAGGTLILLVLVIYNFRRRRIIKMNHFATGLVTDSIKRTGLKGNRYYETVIKYRPVTGNEILLRHFTSRKPGSLEKGSEVPLYYDPARPGKYVLKEDSRARSNYMVFGIIVIVFWVAATCSLFLL